MIEFNRGNTAMETYSQQDTTIPIGHALMQDGSMVEVSADELEQFLDQRGHEIQKRKKPSVARPQEESAKVHP
jgi:hypothetical protein